jgi:hypothetical protein
MTRMEEGVEMEEGHSTTQVNCFEAEREGGSLVSYLLMLHRASQKSVA